MVLGDGIEPEADYMREAMCCKNNARRQPYCIIVEDFTEQLCSSSLKLNILYSQAGYLGTS
jgi:hypothetical protein